MANCDQEKIRRVYSKEQALSQCRTWLSKNMPQAHLIPVSSTSVAAQTALREEGAAAVASREAAVRYGLRILFCDIEDSPSNETRFAVIGLQESFRGSQRKTAVAFPVPPNPSPVCRAPNNIKQKKENLTLVWIFPTK